MTLFATLARSKVSMFPFASPDSPTLAFSSGPVLYLTWPGLGSGPEPGLQPSRSGRWLSPFDIILVTGEKWPIHLLPKHSQCITDSSFPAPHQLTQPGLRAHVASTPFMLLPTFRELSTSSPGTIHPLARLSTDDRVEALLKQNTNMYSDYDSRSTTLSTGL